MKIISDKFNSLSSMVLFGISLMVFGVSANENVKKKPNIVFILADDLGAHTLSMDGKALSPSALLPNCLISFCLSVMIKAMVI